MLSKSSFILFKINPNFDSMYKKPHLIVFILLLAANYAYTQCNGAIELCNKRYDEVAYLTTHNAYNSVADNFMLPNHNKDIAQQLNEGVRAMMLDVYDSNGVPTLYHVYDFLGSLPFSENLDDIKAFLDNNPNEIVTIILECYVSANMIEDALTTAGLMPYLFEKDNTTDWPTLQEMINTDKRLVILSDVDDGSATQGWYHYMWTHAVETDYANNAISDFSCDFNRGDPANDLFILNHFITDATLGVGLPQEAATVNGNPYFINRVLQCQVEAGKFPNFITVDFYEEGNSMSVVNTMNGLVTSTTSPDLESMIRLSPNPVQTYVHVELPESFGRSTVVIVDVQGKICQTAQFSQTETLYLDSLPAGLYFIQIENNGHQVYVEKVVKQ